jgi:hypothetical protein
MINKKPIKIKIMIFRVKNILIHSSSNNKDFLKLNNKTVREIQCYILQAKNKYFLVTKLFKQKSQFKIEPEELLKLKDKTKIHLEEETLHINRN